jgi:peptidoglycan/LPS O-acetylase OafA/YrhL
VLWGAAQWGPFPFILLSLACTVPFAIASWWLVEKRAMSLKKWEWWRAFDGVATKPVKS